MATIKMMQGDSYAVFVELSLQETAEPVTPGMVSEVEVTVGESLRKTYGTGEVLYHEEIGQWYFTPSQQETFALDPESYDVQARVRFKNGQYSSTKGISVGKIMILDANSSEVI